MKHATDRSAAAKKAAATRKHRVAGKKAAATKKHRAAGKKAAESGKLNLAAKKRSGAAVKANATRKPKAAAKTTTDQPVAATQGSYEPLPFGTRFDTERFRLGSSRS